MIGIAADTHKDSHTLAAVDAGIGQVLAEVTVRARRRSFEDLLVWARALDDGQRVWAIEDCRHVSGALERFLLARGERVMRVPPKLMAGARRPSRPSIASTPRLRARPRYRYACCGTSAAPRSTHDAHVAEPRSAIACGPRHPRLHQIRHTDHFRMNP